MNVDKRHLSGALLLLAGAVTYNVWVFTRPAATTASSRIARGPAPVDALPAPAVSDARNSAPIDPTQIPPVTDVVLDRLPQWPRNPFENPRRVIQPAALEVTPVAPPPPEPDIVVATILFSPQRRLAMVNGRIAAVGDRIGSATIVEIQQKAIVVDSPTQGRRIIALRPSLGDKP